jgi:ElaB/YqjD/DUF883 family membrane-anchored ribosome-binding protein
MTTHSTRKPHMPNNDFAETVGDATEEAITRARRAAIRANNHAKDKVGDLGRSVSRYVRDNGPTEMIDDAKRIVKANPGKSLLVVAALGYIIGRMTARRRPSESGDRRRGEAID